MRIIVSILAIVFVGTASAQTFKGEATLPQAEKDGFYRIAIPVSLGAHVNSDFTNLRIYDQQNKEVPYLFQQESPNYYSEVFKEYEIIEKKQQKNCCTTLTLRNPNDQPINNISLSIRNAEVTKHATLLGSDDKVNWFALKQHFILTTLSNQTKTSEIRIVDFPLSNYTYYQLQLEDSTSAPLNILNAGYYEVNSEEGKFTEVSGFQISKSKKGKTSLIKIKFDTTLVVDKLVMTMTGTHHFLRSASLSIKKERLTRKGRKEIYYSWLQNFELSSKQSSVLEFIPIHADELLIEVDNEDNPPLDVSSIKAYQLNRYLTAWLKKGETYKVKIGDTSMQEPVYDIGHFRDSIPNQPPVLVIGKVSILDEVRTETPTFFTNRFFIWIAIAIVIAILGFMTLKMVRETEKRK